MDVAREREQRPRRHARDNLFPPAALGVFGVLDDQGCSGRVLNDPPLGLSFRRADEAPTVRGGLKPLRDYVCK